MASHDYGKDAVAKWIRERFRPDSAVLDVGACDGKWKRLLYEFDNMDAIEIWQPNADRIRPIYRTVINADVYDIKYPKYDLIIFGDVIEHMSVDRAKAVLRYAKSHCRDLVVAVPFLYPQGELYGNPYEAHVQDDLTHELFMKRFPGFEVLHDTGMNYCFYHKKEAKK